MIYNTTNQYITTKEASKQLFTTEYTIRKYIRKGILKAVKLPKQYLVPVDEIARLLNNYRGLSGETK